MAIAIAARRLGGAERVRGTVAMLERRGYAVSQTRLAELCLGGPLSEAQVEQALRDCPELSVRHGLVVSPSALPRLAEVMARSAGHAAAAARYLPSTLRFARALVSACPHVLSVSIAGSLASGGFRLTDDVDLNLVVEDGRRHTAYVALNLLGCLHALRHRGKPVDGLSRRPLAPRLMTANLILERSECFPLARQDEDMAIELLQSEPVFGAAFLKSVVLANPGLLEHLPQLAGRAAPLDVGSPRRLPAWTCPGVLEPPARRLARAGWRYMQWTRRHRPEALARVAHVRRTMRPYTLFPDL